jgi:hypothetical protein
MKKEECGMLLRPETGDGRAEKVEWLARKPAAEELGRKNEEGGGAEGGTRKAGKRDVRALSQRAAMPRQIAECRRQKLA